MDATLPAGYGVATMSRDVRDTGREELNAVDRDVIRLSKGALLFALTMILGLGSIGGVGVKLLSVAWSLQEDMRTNGRTLDELREAVRELRTRADGVPLLQRDVRAIEVHVDLIDGRLHDIEVGMRPRGAAQQSDRSR